jgi:hypothetical protein
MARALEVPAGFIINITMRNISGDGFPYFAIS